MKYVYPCFCVGNAEGRLHNIEKGRCHAMHEMALGQIISFTQCAVSSTRGSLLINGVYLCVHFHFHLNKLKSVASRSRILEVVFLSPAFNPLSLTFPYKFSRQMSMLIF